MKTINNMHTILILFSIGGIIYPPVGIVAIICMLAPLLRVLYGQKMVRKLQPRVA